MQHILVTTDFSEGAARAYGPARSLATAFGAKVSLVNIIYDSVAAARALPVGTPVGLSDLQEERRRSREALDEIAATFPAELTVETFSNSSTDVADAIVEAAQERGADLVVLATHGRKGLGRLALGSVAEGVLRRSPVPVLCCPIGRGPEGEGSTFARILLATDLSRESRRAMAPTLVFARELGSSVRILHVVPELLASPHGAPLAPPVPSPDLPAQLRKARRELDEIESSLAPLSEGIELDSEVLHGEKPAQAVVDHAHEHAFDLIALSTHGRTGFRRLALGSVAEQILRHSEIPVLSFHRPVE